jgi:hypothetical protein
MTTLYNDLLTYQQKRKTPDWLPKPSATRAKIGYGSKPDEQVILRCLAFIDLEEKVGLWVAEAKDSLPDNIEPFLFRNIADEDKHTLAINHLRDYYTYDLAFKPWSTEAAKLVERWKASEAHPIVSAYALECGIFFTILPLLQKLGEVYAATVAVWINDDERVHVETNLRLMRHFQLKLSKDLIRLVYDTVEFIFQPQGAEKAQQQANRAVKRIITAKDSAMLEESLPVTISYFEQESNQTIVY